MSRFASHAFRSRALTSLAVGTLATAALLASPTIATAAQPDVSVLQAKVYYSFKDLATDQGTRALYARITSAARSVCPGYDSQDLGTYADSRACQRQAVARAIRQIGNARLAAVHSHKLARHG